LKEARNRCGYCLAQELVTGIPMEFEHIKPVAQGGKIVKENLWLSCSLCNSIKQDREEAQDPITKEIVPLFNPRTQVWSEHFGWEQNATIMVGKTEIGRATIVLLDLNKKIRVDARRIWVLTGYHPPKD
jgi:HNH endonuclease